MGLAVSSQSLGKIACVHNHLFESPFCKELSLIKRIIIIVFHIITLCIPLGIYYVVSFCKSKKTVDALRSGQVVREVKDISIDELVFKTLLYTNSLSEETDLDVWMWEDSLVEIRPDSIIYPGYDPSFGKKVSLYWNCFDAFKEALKNNPENTWKQKDVLKAADRFLKVGFAISNQTFNDLPYLYSRISQLEDDLDLTYEEILLNETAYAYYTGYYCRNAYAWIKSCVTWDVEKERFAFPNEDEIKGHLDGQYSFELEEDEYLGRDFARIVKPTRIICPCTDLSFYKPGVLQNNWRLLYNEYVTRFSKILLNDPYLYLSKNESKLLDGPLLDNKVVPDFDREKGPGFLVDRVVFENTMNRFESLYAEM